MLSNFTLTDRQKRSGKVKFLVFFLTAVTASAAFALTLFLIHPLLKAEQPPAPSADDLSKISVQQSQIFPNGSSTAATDHFVVTVNSPRAAEYARYLEYYYRILPKYWFGNSPPAGTPLSLTAKVPVNIVEQPGQQPTSGGGATVFTFGRSREGLLTVIGMRIRGTPNALRMSVIPHEVNHITFARYFKMPLPRWADEGSATDIECAAVRRNIQRLLVRFLTSGRGIAFNNLVFNKTYSADILPQYAEGASLAGYLVYRGGGGETGRKKFASFLAEFGKTLEVINGQPGDSLRRWEQLKRASAQLLQKYFNVKDLNELQILWQAAVRKSCRENGDFFIAMADACRPQQPRPKPRPQPSIPPPQPPSPSPQPIKPAPLAPLRQLEKELAHWKKVRGYYAELVSFYLDKDKKVPPQISVGLKNVLDKIDELEKKIEKIKAAPLPRKLSPLMR